MTKWHQGRFRPKNYKKYKGDPTQIFYRSGWELTLMSRFDKDPNILQWSSEERPIPYKDPVSGRLRRYFPDFYVKLKTKQGKVKEQIVEVKPLKEAFPPQQGEGPKARTRYIKELNTYLRNVAKWKAAKMYCERQGYEFCVVSKGKNNEFTLLTEDQLKL